MDVPYRSYAATHPRNRHGQFKGKIHSPPECVTLTHENQATSPQSPLTPLSGDATNTLEAQNRPRADGYTGWGTGLWRGISRSALAAGERDERNTLYLELGVPGVNTFEVFDRLTALGEHPEID